MVSNLDNDKAEILLYDLKEDKVLKKVFSNDQYDVSDVGISRKRNWELTILLMKEQKKWWFL